MGGRLVARVTPQHVSSTYSYRVEVGIRGLGACAAAAILLSSKVWARALALRVRALAKAWKTWRRTTRRCSWNSFQISGSVINARLLDTPPTIDGAGFTCVQHPVDVSDWYDPSDMAENYHEPMKALVSQLLADSDEFEEPMFTMTNGHLTRNEAEAEAGERLGAHHLVHKYIFHSACARSDTLLTRRCTAYVIAAISLPNFATKSARGRHSSTYSSKMVCL